MYARSHPENVNCVQFRCQTYWYYFVAQNISAHELGGGQWFDSHRHEASAVCFSLSDSMLPVRRTRSERYDSSSALNVAATGCMAHYVLNIDMYKGLARLLIMYANSCLHEKMWANRLVECHTFPRNPNAKPKIFIGKLWLQRQFRWRHLLHLICTYARALTYTHICTHRISLRYPYVAYWHCRKSFFERNDCGTIVFAFNGRFSCSSCCVHFTRLGLEQIKANRLPGDFPAPNFSRTNRSKHGTKIPRSDVQVQRIL